MEKRQSARVMVREVACSQLGGRAAVGRDSGLVADRQSRPGPIPKSGRS